MKKRLLMIMVAILSAASMMADDITKSEALWIASQFAQSPQVEKISKRRAPIYAKPELAYTVKSELADRKDNVYVVNLGGDYGFVVVSGETGMEDEILGYCDHGTFEYDKAPVQMKALLKNYSASVDCIRQNPQLAVSVTRRAAGFYVDLGNVIVPILLKTTWNQWAPYNYLCPEGCPSGCVPTAIAQVMYYYRWPEKTIGTVNEGEDFSGHTYDWDNMINSYDNGFTSEQADAVAKLMADIGKAFGTSYHENGSPTPFVPEPLGDNFCYEPGISVKYGESPAELVDDLKAELDENRPVLVAGQPVTEDGDGHALVCDGYTSKNYFHFNYGWGGYCDGYYKNAMMNIYYGKTHIFKTVRPYDAVRKVIDDVEYGMLKNGTAEVLEYKLQNVTDKELIIPATVKDDDDNEYKVTRIRKNAFYNKGSFSKVVIGENIEVIDQFAFIMSNINELVLSDKMEVVPDEAFMGTYVNKLTIGASVKHIGKKAFYTCPLSEVICKSEAFDVDENAFAWSTPDCGAWLDCITSLGKQAFAAANFEKGNPHFAKLERIDSLAFQGVSFSGKQFVLPPKLKFISSDAFNKGVFYGFEPNDENPYFYASQMGYLLNKNQTSLVLVSKTNWDVGDSAFPFSENLLKMEPGCITSRDNSVTIPNTVIQMEGAFKNCERVSSITCQAIVPPVITDSTFNNKMFENSTMTLYVPEGYGDLYRNAPGWRRFENISAFVEYKPMPDQDRQYLMVLHGTDIDKEAVHIPVSEISKMEIDESTGQLLISRMGKEDVTTMMASVDSVTWMTGFVYEQAEVFDLNDSTLTVEAQKVSLEFDRTVIDGDAQVSIRNAVVQPGVLEGATRAEAFDISLSTGEHELSGTVDITVPIEVAANEKAYAAYFNEETGKWEPVKHRYDADKKQMVISTNHLSTYTIFWEDDRYEFTRKAMLDLYWGGCPTYYALNEATKLLLEVISSDDPDMEQVRKFKDDWMFWQGVGMDGLYNMFNGAANGLGFSYETLDNASKVLGYLGMAVGICDVIGADIRGDDVGVASSTLSLIMNYATGQMSSWVGTPIMTASMGCTAFIGVALNYLGTMVQERKHDLYRDALYYFYSKTGSAEVHGCYRSPKDWYNYFYPVFKRPMTKEKLDALINQAISMYCSKFWSSEYHDAYVWSCKEMNVWGITSFPYPDQALQDQISEEYKAELLNGELKSVFTAIKKNLAIEAENRYNKYAQDVADLVNHKMALRFTDSSVTEEDGVSKYAGKKLRFTEIPDCVKDPEAWACEAIPESGKTYIGYFTTYALDKCGIKPKVTLYDENDVALKEYSFTVPDGTKDQYIDIDLESGGVAVEFPELKGLEVTYDPSTWYLEGERHYIEDHETGKTGQYVYLNLDWYDSYFRYQAGLEKYFAQHNFITVDNLGNIAIGDDIIGRFENGSLEGGGKFKLEVPHSFVLKTPEQYVNAYNTIPWADIFTDSNISESDFDKYSILFTILLGGNITFKMDCEFTITRTADNKEFEINYTGSGTYDLVLDYVGREENFSLKNRNNGKTQHMSLSDITVAHKNCNGKAEFKYSTKLKQK